MMRGGSGMESLIEKCCLLQTQLKTMSCSRDNFLQRTRSAAILAGDTKISIPGAASADKAQLSNSEIPLPRCNGWTITVAVAYPKGYKVFISVDKNCNDDESSYYILVFRLQKWFEKDEPKPDAGTNPDSPKPEKTFSPIDAAISLLADEAKDGDAGWFTIIEATYTAREYKKKVALALTATEGPSELQDEILSQEIVPSAILIAEGKSFLLSDANRDIDNGMQKYVTAREPQ